MESCVTDGMACMECVCVCSSRDRVLFNDVTSSSGEKILHGCAGSNNAALLKSHEQ
jgi:hypothetical protein